MTVKVVKFDVAKLKSHPKQNHFFREPTDEAIRQLADDMKLNGQREPITVLPDGRIICGHIRRAAALLLGWTKIDAIVRHDLAGKEDEVERLLIADNANRRQLSKLERVRCAMRLFELEGGTESTKSHDRARARKRVAEQMGLSDKEVSRLLDVLAAPAEVQTAFDGDMISLVDAVRVANLPEDVRKQIAKRIKRQGLNKAKGIIQEHLPKPAIMRPDAGQAYAELLDNLAAACRELPAKTSEIDFADGSAEDRLVGLRQGQALLKKLVAAEKRALAGANKGKADGESIKTNGQLDSGTRTKTRQQKGKKSGSAGAAAGCMTRKTLSCLRNHPMYGDRI